MNYKPVIGLEVHVELKTQSKMFCGCSADYFGKKPNTYTCPVCLGLPGALPVPNKTAIEWCVKIGMALNCKIPLFSKFDRKNYFYPDLPKGYQISQYDQPFCVNGTIELKNGKKIRIRRVHMEEDTAKLMHEFGIQNSEFKIQNEGKFSLIDFNRSGVPLVEIVTEPDFESASEVKDYLQKLQQIVRYLEVSNADMERGDMRLEPNISLREQNPEAGIKNQELPKYKVEVKNINSFRFVEKAIEFEIKRQEDILNKGETPRQETRGWDEKKNQTVSQRSKEEAMDYRYFPEPDIPPIRWEESRIKNLELSMPELPDQKRKRFEQEYNLSSYDAEILTRERTTADYFMEAAKVGFEHKITPKQIANHLINKKVNREEVLPSQLVQTILSSVQTIPIDEGELEKAVDKVLIDNKKAVEDYKAGKEQALMYLVGSVMREITKNLPAGRQADTNLVKDKIKERIK